MLKFGNWADVGWKGKLSVLSSFAGREHHHQTPKRYLRKAQTEREQNGQAGSISCEWFVPCSVNPVHASLLMPLSRVVCRVGRTFPLLALNISAKELQIPRKLSL